MRKLVLHTTNIQPCHKKASTTLQKYTHVIRKLVLHSTKIYTCYKKASTTFDKNIHML